MDLSEHKRLLRAELSARRDARPATEIEAARAALRTVVLQRVGLARVAAYVPLRTEPGSRELLDALHDSGSHVLVPVLLADRDLDWISWPSGTSLGVDAIASATLVLVPALAVDRTGVRLGRGGGSYDRALRRVPPHVPVAALLYDDELRDDPLPRAPWDVPVRAVAQPRGWTQLTGFDAE